MIENCFKSGTSKELQTYIEQAKILKLDVSGILPLTNDPTLLHLAVEGGLVSLVQVVLSMENRPNLDIKDGLGWTGQ